MAYQINGNVVIDDDGNGFFENLPLILAPTILEPEEGEALTGNVEIVATAFSGIYKTFLSSQLQIANTSSFESGNIVFDSGVVIPGSNIFDAGLIAGNLFARVRYSSSDNVISEFSNVRSFFAEIPPTVIGQSFGGGFYTGTIDIGGGVCYFLVVSPNSTGCACCQWKTTRTATSGTGSCVNGFTNTYPPLANASHPAGNWTATRTIAGFSDWYLPARDELNVLYTNKGSMPAGEGYASDGYWSSTELNSGDACCQNFDTGTIGLSFKTSTFRARAVRRIAIPN